VDKGVRATLIGLDEAKTFLAIEPLDGSSRHEKPFQNHRFVHRRSSRPSNQRFQEQKGVGRRKNLLNAGPNFLTVFRPSSCAPFAAGIQGGVMHFVGIDCRGRVRAGEQLHRGREGSRTRRETAKSGINLRSVRDLRDLRALACIARRRCFPGGLKPAGNFAADALRPRDAGLSMSVKRAYATRPPPPRSPPRISDPPVRRRTTTSKPVHARPTPPPAQRDRRPATTGR
jgi:hypothetical protein